MDANLLLANAEYRELKKTTDAQEKRIAALVALNEQKDAEIARLKREVVTATEVAKYILTDLGEHMEPFCEKLTEARLAASYERGAGEFAEWLRNETALRFDNGVIADGAVVQYLARFLASRGTAESKGE